MNNNNILNETFAKHLGLLKEKISPDQIDPKLFPTKLSQAKAQAGLSTALATSGVEDKKQEDDTEQTKEGASYPASELSPGQTTMDLDKFIGMAIQMFLKSGGFKNGPGGDLGAIISNDLHIMDGHHRWAATVLVNPGTPVKGLWINIPGEKLIGILNVWTVAHGGSGKASTHDLKSITGDMVKQRMIELTSADLQGGKDKEGRVIIAMTLQQMKDAAVKNNTTFEQMAEMSKQNWESVNPAGKIKSWMPTKLDMPAIEPDQLKQVATDILSGKMDLMPPYSKQTVDQSLKKGIREPAFKNKELGGSKPAVTTEEKSKINETFEKHIGLLRDHLKNK